MSPAPSDSTAAALPAARAIELDRAAERSRGIALMILAVGLFAVMDALVKWVGPTYPTLQIVFFRNLFAFVPLAFFLLRAGALAGLRTRRPMSHALRSIAGIVSLTCFFYAYAHMPLANVVAIGFAAPLFVTALSVPLLGEPVGPRRWSAVLIGFVGVLIIVQPDEGVLDSVAILALTATALYALVIIFVRKLSRTETSTAIVFYYMLSSVVVTGAFMPFQWVAPDTEGWIVLAAIGLIGGCAQIAITNAFRLGEAVVIAPFDYTAIVWTSALGFFVWGEVPGANIWLGAAIVMASSLYILFREARLGLPRYIARRLQTRR